MKSNEVIDLSPYFNALTMDIKKDLHNKAKVFASKMYDRQKEFNSNFNEKAFKERVFKIYLGLISEKLLHDYLTDENIFDLNKNNLLFSGSIQGDVNDSKPDEFDLMVNGVSIDIKSSKNNKEIIFKNGENFKDFCLHKRNFTIPKDQVSKTKEVVIQIMYNLIKKDDGTHKVENIYCYGGIRLINLIEEKNLVNLKLNNGNYQQTYMTPLCNGDDLVKLLDLKLASKKENDLSIKI